MLVVENQAAFEFRYGQQLPVAGAWSGGLNNNSETITVMTNGSILQQFTYQDDWHTTTDGDGMSLEIIDASADLDDWNVGTSWQPSSLLGGTPGTGPASQLPGDANGDGVFNSSDLVTVFAAGEYEDGIVGNSTFEEGDWNGDGDFTTSDLVFALQQGNYVAESVPAASRIGEQVEDATSLVAEMTSRPPRLVSPDGERDLIFAEWSGDRPSAFGVDKTWDQEHEPGNGELDPWV